MLKPRWLLPFLLVLALFSQGALAAVDPNCPQQDPTKPFVVAINWTAPANGVNGLPLLASQLPLTFNLYMVTVKGTEAGSTPFKTGLTGTTTGVTATFQPNTSYYFTMVAVDALGNPSAQTNEVCTTSPALAPGTFTITITSS